MRAAKSSQEQPGAASNSQEQPEAAWAARSSQEQPGAARSSLIFHVVRGRASAYLSIPVHICTYLTYLRVLGESARIWSTCAYLNISALIGMYLAHLRVPGVS